MTNEARYPNEDVSALLAERQRYEDWLAALDARRETTPKHVFDRVRADYETRLKAVVDRMSRHRGELEQQVKRLAERISILQSQERQKRDERSELELRAHVGELSADGYREAVRALDDALSALSGEQGALSGELARTREFLGVAAAPPSRQAAAHAPPAAAAASAYAQASAPRPGQQPVAPSPPPAQQRQPVPPPPAPEAEQPQNFDEIAFLNSVVGKQKAARTEAVPPAPAPAPAPVRRANGAGDDLNIMRDEAATLAESLLSRMNKPAPGDIVRQEPIDALNGPKRDSNGGAHGMAGNVTGNNPIVLRPGGDPGSAKTLKCAECGSMNYPTEWYCERCGAELASL